MNGYAYDNISSYTSYVKSKLCSTDRKDQTNTNTKKLRNFASQRLNATIYKHRAVAQTMKV